MSFGAETHLVGGVISDFVFVLAAIAQALVLTFTGSTAFRKGSQRVWLHCHKCRHALIFRCRNSPWWQSCECCNIFCLPLGCHCSFDSSPHVLCALIGMRWKLATYITRAAFERGFNTSWWMQTESAQVFTKLVQDLLPGVRLPLAIKAGTSIKA